MKKIIKLALVLGFLTSSIDAYSRAIVCMDILMNDCIEYTRVSDDGGKTWRNACCGDMNLNLSGYYCEDDCFIGADGPVSEKSGNSVFELINDEAFEGIEYSVYDPTLKKKVNYLVEFIGENIFLNNEVVTKFKTNIKFVELILPGMNKAVRLKSSMPNIAIINEIAKNMAFADLVKVKMSPNPLQGNELNVEIDQTVSKVLIYDMQGLLVYTHNDKFKGSCQLMLPNLKPGSYIVEFHFTNGAKRKREKLLVLD